MRRQKQWEYLEQADPEEDLEQHLEALEKAKAKAEKKLKELKQKKQEEEEEEEESYYSCSASSSRSRSKSSKRSKASRKRPATLEKVAEDNEAAALEKVVAKAEATLEKVVSVRRTRRAKDGKAEELVEELVVEGQPTKIQLSLASHLWERAPRRNLLWKRETLPRSRRSLLWKREMLPS